MDELLIFVSYAQKDRRFADEFTGKLGVEFPGAYIWSRKNILPGQKPELAVRDHIRLAQIIVLLVSPSLLVLRDELAQIEAKHRAREGFLIPILVRPARLEHTFLAHIESWPSNHVPLSRFLFAG